MRDVAVVPLWPWPLCGGVQFGLCTCGVVWCGVVWCGVVWCGVVWCGVVWCGVVWCGVVHPPPAPWALRDSLEKRTLDRMNSDVYESLREAAEVHRTVRKYAQSIIRPGIVLADMCEKIENMNRSLVKEDGLNVRDLAAWRALRGCPWPGLCGAVCVWVCVGVCVCCVCIVCVCGGGGGRVGLGTA
jgi:hypothetical protein